MSAVTEIETERLLLRGWREDDVEPYARICANPEVMRYIASGATLTREGSAAQIGRFVRHWEEHGFGLWAAEEKETGTLLGFVGLAHLGDWTEGGHEIEVGWRLGREFWGRGFATEGARASVAHGFEELYLATIISIIQPENTASRRVAEKAGLTLRGETLWRNNRVVWYATDRNEWEAGGRPAG